MEPEPEPDVDVDVDVLIVGAGPTGLFACYYAGLRELSVAVLDGLPQVGGQLMALYPDKPIYDVAGHVEVTGCELVTSLHKQSESAAPTWILSERAVELERGPEEVLSVTTDKGTKIRARGVILAAGIGNFAPRRLAAAEEFEGRGLYYSLSSGQRFSGEHVVVVGGGDSAVDWANMLATTAASVCVVHRRRMLRAHQGSVNRLAQNGVRVIVDAEIVAVTGDAAGVQSVEISSRAGGSETLTASAVIAALGQVADLGPLLSWGCASDMRQLVVDSHMETSVRGVFAAGDVTTYPGKVRIMAAGFGEAATAVNNLAARIRPGESVFPGHSTTLVADRKAMTGA